MIYLTLRLFVMKSPDSISELRRRIAANDQAAYRELFELYYDKLFRLALLICKSRELSEEIISDVFIKLWRKRDELEKIENLRLYLYVAVKNTSLNYLAQLRRNVFIPLDQLEFEPDQPFTNPEELLITKEMNQRIFRAIQSLPPRCKMIFKLVKEDGLTYKEAAELLHLSVATIDNQLVLAIKKLSKALYYSFTAAEKKS